LLNVAVKVKVSDTTMMNITGKAGSKRNIFASLDFFHFLN